MRIFRLTATLLLAGALFACSDTRVTTPPDAELTAQTRPHRNTAAIPQGPVQRPTYVTGAAPQQEGVVRVYQDEQPWFGSNRAHASLLNIGKQLGVDYFIHPLAALQQGIPEGTELVVITSNSFGEPGQAQRQNHPDAQAALVAFLEAGGKLIVDMGDNLPDGGFIAPGAEGTPALIFPDPCEPGFIVDPSHPLFDAFHTLTDADVSMEPDFCSVAHGNLEQGITLPGDAEGLITAIFNGPQRLILAEYCYEGTGRVILDTMTKEFAGFPPAGDGPSRFMDNLFTYGLSADADCDGVPPPPIIEVDIDNVYSGPPPRAPGIINLTDDSVYVEIFDIEQYLGRSASADDVRIGPSFGAGTPATHFEILDINGDSNLDIRVRWSLAQLVADGRLSLQTQRLTIWGFDEADAQRYRGIAEVEVIMGDVAIDQNQPSATVFMAAFAQTDLAQSFQTQQSDRPTAGAGIFLQPGVGGTDNVRISLWDALPNQPGANMLAQGQAQGTQGEWVDVFWPGVLLTANTTYYLVFDGNTTLGIAGDINNPYPHGHVFANPGFGPFPTFDYTFRTWVEVPEGLGPNQVQRMRTSAPHGSPGLQRGGCAATARGC